ncbi:MAG: MauE/DoxX family redox-associated membrane protein [Planctomycetota bacterium]
MSGRREAVQSACRRGLAAFLIIVSGLKVIGLSMGGEAERTVDVAAHPLVLLGVAAAEAGLSMLLLTRWWYRATWIVVVMLSLCVAYLLYLQYDGIMRSCGCFGGLIEVPFRVHMCILFGALALCYGAIVNKPGGHTS